jgi:hypothetical protein
VLVGSNMYAVPLTVPRVFYVNSSLPPSDPQAAALGELVKRILPFGQEPLNVYKVPSTLHSQPPIARLAVLT